MKEDLQFEGKKYISSRRAAQSCGYTQDYIGQLIRSKKIDARMVGRAWFVSEESVVEYKALADSAQGGKSLFSKNENITLPTPEKVEVKSQFTYFADERPLLPEIKKVEPLAHVEVVPETPKEVVQSVPVKSSFVGKAVVSDIRSKLLAGFVSLSLIASSFWMSDVENTRAAYKSIQTAGEYVQGVLDDSYASVSSAVAKVASTFGSVLKNIKERNLASVATMYAVRKSGDTAGQNSSTTKSAVTTSDPLNVTNITNISGVTSQEVSALIASVRKDIELQIKGINTTSSITIQNVRNAREANKTEVISDSKINDSVIRNSSIVRATDLSVIGDTGLTALNFINATGTNATTSNFYTDNLTALNITFTSSSVTNSTTSNATTTNLYADLLTANNAIVSNFTSYASPIAPYFTATSTNSTSTFAGGVTVGNGNVVITDTGRIGIGTTTPVGALSIFKDAGNITTSTFYNTLNSQAIATSSGGGQFRPHYFSVTATGTLSFQGISNLNLDVWNRIANGTTTMEAISSNLRITGTSNSDIAYGYRVIPILTTTGRVDNYIGFEARTPGITSGTITNAYGLYLQSQLTAGVTNGYGVYQAGSNDRNYFAGNVGIGTTTPGNPLVIASTTAAGAYFEGLRIGTNNANSFGTYMTFARAGSATRGLVIGEQYSGNLLAPTIRTAGGESQHLEIRAGRDSSDNGGVVYFNLTGSPTSVINQATTSFSGNTSVGTSTVSGNGLFMVATSSPLFYVDKITGNVGIGTSSPTRPLQIWTTGADSLQINRQGTFSVGDTVGLISFQTGSGSATDANAQMRSFVKQVGAEYLSDLRLRVRSAGGGMADIVTVDYTGNVGIGTTSPYAKLSVAGQVVGESFVATSTSATSTFMGSVSIGTTSPFASGLFSVGTSTPNIYVDRSSGFVGIGTTSAFWNLTTYGRDGASMYVLDATSSIGVQLSGNNPRIVFNDGRTGGKRFDLGGQVGPGTFGITDPAAGNASRFLVDYTGSIGFGTTSPYAKVSIASVTAASTTLALRPVSGQTGNILDIYNPSGVLTNVITAAGNVGIGTTTPQRSLHIVGNGAIVERFGATPLLVLRGGPDSSTGRDWKINVDQTTSNLNFVYDLVGGTNNNFAMTVTNSGNVGIGTTSASSRLSIKTSGDNDGIVLERSSAGSNQRLFAVSQENTDAGRLFLYDAGTAVINFNADANSISYINTGGNFGIGTTSPFNKFSVAGNAYIGGNLTATGTFSITGATTLATTTVSVNSSISSGYLFKTEYTGSNNRGVALGGDGSSGLLQAYAPSLGVDGAGQSLKINPNGGDVNVGPSSASIALMANGTIRQPWSNNFLGTYFSGGTYRLGLTTQIDNNNRVLYIDNQNADGIATNPGIQFRTGSGPTTVMTILDNGNVGLGTTTPRANLTVNGSTGQNLFQIATSTNQNILVVNANGNIGAGVSSPLVKLDVSGGALFRGVNSNTPITPVAAVEFATGRDNAGAIPSGATSADVAFQWAGFTGGYRHWISTKHNTGANTGNGLEFFINTGSNATESSAVGVGNTRVLGLYGNGNVGIGSTTPVDKLSVLTNVAGTYAASFVNSAGSGKGVLIQGGASGLNNILDVRTFSGSDVINVLGNGNVGIGGDSNPAERLVVALGGSPAILLNNTSDSSFKARVKLNYNPDNTFQILMGNSETQVFGSNITGSSVFFPNGNVGIGTTSPSASLQVSRSQTAASGLARGVYFEQGLTATANGDTLSALDVVPTYSVGAFTGVNTYAARFLSEDTTGTGLAIGRTNGFFSTLRTDFSSRNFIIDTGASGGSVVLRQAGSAALTAASAQTDIAGGLTIGNTVSAFGLNNAIQVQNTVDGYITFRNGTNGYKAALGHNGAGDMVFYGQAGNTTLTAADEKMRIMANGNVGIGTSSPSGTLSLAGSAGQTKPLFIVSTSSASFGTSTAFVITSSGAVGIGTTNLGNNFVRIAKDLGSSNVNASEHNLQLEVRRTGDNKKLGIGILDDGRGVIQASEAGVGYSNLLLNPINGSVGIGTSTPTGKLHVYGETRIGDSSANGYYLKLASLSGYSMLESEQSGVGWQNLVLQPNSNGNSRLGVGTTSPSAKLAVTGNSGGTRIFVASDSSNVERFVVQSNGNVGIGSSSPSTKLSIAGVNGETMMDWRTDTYQVGRLGSDSSHNGFLSVMYGGQDGVYLSGNSTSYFRSGNVGIGTTTPASKLSVVNTSSGLSNAIFPTNAIGQFEFGGSNAVVSLAVGGTYDAGYVFSNSSGAYDGVLGYANSARALYFSTAGTEKMRITSSGNVGIGTTTPGNALTVSVNASAAAVVSLTNTHSNGYTGIDFYNNAGVASGALFYANGSAGVLPDTMSIGPRNTTGSFNVITGTGLTPRITVLTGGNVGISSTSPWAKLSIAMASTTPSLVVGTAGSSSPAFYVSSANGSGNVGIGTANPNAVLDVRGSSTGSNTFAFGYTSDGSMSNQQRFQSDGSGASLRIITPSAGALFLIPANGTAAKASFSNSGACEVNTAYCFTAGNVGIGTTTPYSMLNPTAKVLNLVNTSSQATVAITGNNQELALTAHGSGAYLDLGGASIGTNNNFIWRTTSNNSSYSIGEVMRLTASGNLGIGTTSPDGLLTVYKAGFGASSIGATFHDAVTPAYASNADNLLTVRGTGSSGSTWRGRITAGGDNRAFLMGEYNSQAWLGAHTANLGAWADLYINPDGTTQSTYIGDSGGGPAAPVPILTVSNALGNVGVGTSSPQYPLSVAADSFISAVFKRTTTALGGSIIKQENGAGSYWGYGTLGSADGGRFAFLDNSLSAGVNERLSILPGGNVGIGTTSPYARLSVTPAGAADVGIVVTTNTGTPVIRTFGSGNPRLLVGTGSDDNNNNLQVTGTAAISGNVGIGTTTPDYKLQVNGTNSLLAKFVNTTASDQFGGAGILGAHNDGSAMASGDRLGFFLMGGATDSANSLNNSSGMQAFATQNWSGTAAGSNLQFLVQPNNTVGTSNRLTAMTIDQNGNVGIGTTSPYARLSVVGEAVARNFTATSTTATSTFAGGFDVGNGSLRYDLSTGVTSIDNLEVGNTFFETDAGIIAWADMPVTAASANGVVNSYSASINGNPLLTIYSVSDGAGGVTNASVGVGTTSPMTTLSVQGTTTAAAFNAYSLTSTSTLRGFLDVLGTGTNSTSTYSSNLWVKGNLRTTGNTYTGDLIFANNFAFTEGDLATTSIQKLILKNQYRNDLFVIDENGHVGFGTTSDMYKMYVDGDVAATSFVNVSTRTAKKDISYMNDTEKESVLTSLRSLGVARYRYNEESEASPLRLGLIAEEAPVEVLSAGGKGVDVYKLSTFILAGVQELAQKLDEVTARVTSIESRLASLEAFNQSIFASTSINYVNTNASTTLDAFANWFVSLGASIEQGVVRFASVVADTVTAKKLTVGDSTNLAASGITILDRVTGQPACVFVENGVMKTELGECGVVIVGPAPQGNEGNTSGVSDDIESTGGDGNGTTSGGSGNGGTTTPDVIPENPQPDNGGTTTPDVITEGPQPEPQPEPAPEPTPEVAVEGTNPTP